MIGRSNSKEVKENRNSIPEKIELNDSENFILIDSVDIETKANSKIEDIDCNFSIKNEVTGPHATEIRELKPKILMKTESMANLDEFQINDSYFNLQDDFVVDITSIYTMGPGINERAYFSKILPLNLDEKCSFLIGLNPKDQLRLIHK